MPPSGARHPSPLAEVAALFLRLGCTAFGGPAAHVALMEHECVRRRGWVTRARFLELWGAAQVIPGPSSTELALHLGLERAGWRGFVAAGVGFIGPAAALVAALAWAYVRWGARPEARALLAGVQPVVVAVVAHATWSLARGAARSRPHAALALAAGVASVAGAPELAVLAAAALAGALAFPRPGAPHDAAAGDGAASDASTRDAAPDARPARAPRALAAPLALGSTASAAGAALAVAPTPLGVGLVFLKLGVVLFGSGYVLVAFLRGELVAGLGWITEAQLLDAVAVGQLTPGPLFTTATFVGWLVAGPAGAFAATVGIFLPAFLGVAVSGVVLPRLRRAPAAAAALDGLATGSLGLLGATAIALGRATLDAPRPAAIAAVAAAVLLTGRVNPGWLVVAGAALGVLVGG